MESVTVWLLFDVWLLGLEVRGILTPQPEMEPAPAASEGEVFKHWTTREVPP